MSDIEDYVAVNGRRGDDEEEEVEHEGQETGHKQQRRAHAEEEAEEEEEEEDDEEDDEDEEDEDEDEGLERGKKRPKVRDWYSEYHRHKRPAVNRFLDVEAEVDEDEEEDEDEDEYGRDEFIADVGGEGEDGEVAPRAAVNARLNLERELNDQDLAKIAADFSERYRRTAVRYTGDMNEIPQRLLMPSVHDANLWQVRVKPGKERDLVFSLMRKAIDLEFSNRPLNILSAFQRDSLPGMIYVEARSAKQVSDACNGLVGIYPSRGIVLVPIEEMASLLQIKKQDLTVTPGSWVRIRRGKYQGDLAQVMDITENGEEVGLKFIPRIDLNPKDDASIDGKKRKKITAGSSSFSMRPPQRFFNYEEVVKVYGRKSVAKRNLVYVFQNDTYKDGFIEKDFKLPALQLDDVNPTLDEITRFTRGQDGADNETAIDLSIIAEASRKAAIAVLQPGDHVEVFEGEQSGVHGTVHSIEQDVVTIQPVGVEFDGQRVQIPARSVRKRFKPGDHVKVMTGQNSDETGLVVSVVDNVVTFLSDMSMQEVSVFSKDLREAAEVGNSTNIVGNYELHDLVQLDLQTVGVIFKTERDSFRVLDQNGQVRLVQPHQISMRRDSNRAIATDSEGHELRINDNVKEVDGEGRKGRVLHTHQSFFAFLFNRDYSENGGVFVTRARSLVSLAPKSNAQKLGATDLSKMNPALSGGAQGGMVGSGNIGRGPRDRLIGVTVMVVKGPRKGYVGTVKDTNGNLARVELISGNKVVQIEKDKLKRRNPDGSLELLEAIAPRGIMGPPSSTPSSWFNNTPGRTPNPYTSGGRTPAPMGGKTPAWNMDSSRTPWGASAKTPDPNMLGRTPHHHDSGGKTPAWNVSRTPNPYADGGRTPQWNTSAPTPNPYASNYNSYGGATPKPSNDFGDQSGGRSTWGGATPGHPSTWGDSNSWDAVGAPTPAWGAPTPAAGAPTPGPQWSAPTPGVYDDYRTPGDIFGGSSSSVPYTPGPAGDDDVDSDKWLLNPKLSHKPGMLCEITNSFPRGTEKGWLNGNHEHEKVLVLSVFNSGNDRFSSRARIKFFDSPGPNPVPEIPVQLLRPVHPEKSGQEIMMIRGNYEGQDAKVRSVEADGGMVVSLTGTMLLIETKAEDAIRVEHVEES
ncbi:hypothetical protein BDY19DRAFT_1041717 [Irpex rosettiformis]|uniref:Uncharacterized protein n=1 Tax=Irpex rosettiformis TaxID=378272 RepID=A0ACB8U433_9APHY|nr:hypothetical protein BDY19DRAFT_1041717 [Irpex rosettiformis]